LPDTLSLFFSVFLQGLLFIPHRRKINLKPIHGKITAILEQNRKRKEKAEKEERQSGPQA